MMDNRWMRLGERLLDASGPRQRARLLVDEVPSSTLAGLGLARFNMKYSHGTLPHDSMLRSIELYGTEVIPRVRELLAESGQEQAGARATLAG